MASNGTERTEHAHRDGNLSRQERPERWPEAVSAFEAVVEIHHRLDWRWR